MRETLLGSEARSTVNRITLFFSWQSDREQKLCRNFIEKALEHARELLADNDIELVIDADTRNVPGSPPITATILEKIDRCDIFLADVTPVAETDDGKKVPNPNVMGEFGYALRAHGHGRILLSLNRAFGAINELPFDIKHQRLSLHYTAPPGIQDNARREARREFGRKLFVAVKAIADSGAQHASAEAADRALERAYEHRAAFLRGSTPAIVSRPCIAIQIAPLAAAGAQPLAPRVAGPIVEGFRPPGFTRAEDGVDSRMWWCSDVPRTVPNKPNPEVDWLFTLTRAGALQFAVNLERRIDTNPRISVNGFQMEAWVVRMTEQLFETAKTLGWGGPALVTVGLEGVEDVDILAGRLPPLRIRPPSILANGPVVTPGETPIATQLRGVLDHIWLEIGHKLGSPSFQGETWRGYGAMADYQLG